MAHQKGSVSVKLVLRKNFTKSVSYYWRKESEGATWTCPYSDVCGRIQTLSLSRGHYFLTLINDKTRYVWVYILKSKDQVFEKLVEWKALAKNSSGQKLKSLHTDNGEYTLAKYTAYLKKEAVHHEFTCSAYNSSTE